MQIRVDEYPVLRYAITPQLFQQGLDVVIAPKKKLTGESYTYYGFAAREELIGWLKKGETVRVKLKGEPLTWYSLKGSSSAINKAESDCRKTLDKHKAHEAYFE
jgi:hypothetical protein